MNRALGLEPDEVSRRLQEDDMIFNIVRPEELMEEPLIPLEKDVPRNSFTYSQRRHMKMRENEQPEGMSLKSDTLNPAYAASIRGRRLNSGAVSAKKRTAAEEACYT